MKIAYLLEDTELSGGVRAVAAQADALAGLGHDVTLVTKGGPITWRHLRAKLQHVDALEDFDASRFDFVVGTFWTTVAVAYAVAGDRAAHLCQGYEASFGFYQSIREDIDAVYALPIPKLTVVPTLVEICRRFTDDVTCVGQIVDDAFFQPHVDGGGRRVLMVGPAQADVKGIDVGYAAVRRARACDAAFDLVRVSQWPPASDEPSDLASEFHVALSTDEMVRLYASCDVLLCTSRKEEGFGLPAAEALASGVAAVLSAIPSFLSWDSRDDYALFAEEGNADATGDALVRILADPALRARTAARGREVVEQFRADACGKRLERFFALRLKR